MAKSDVFQIRTEEAPLLPAPISTTGIIGWMRQNLFSSISNTILTAIGIVIAYWMIAPFIQFAFIDAVWSGENREACLPEEGVHAGACWAYVKAYFPQFIYGRYPTDEIWRVNIVYILFALLLVPLAAPSAPLKKLNAILFLGIFPILAFVLLTGGHIGISFSTWVFVALLALVGVAIAGVQMFVGGRDLNGVMPVLVGFVGSAIVLGAVFLFVSVNFGLTEVETPVWGGLLVTLVIAVTGIVASLPLGIALALGRRSTMPIIKMVSIIFIEFWRGVPLITVLFMSSVMLPLFLPEGVTFDKLLRVLIGVTLFSAAYMAEVVRGGLQAIPKGQYEGAMALGLRFWPMMYLIILPQALKLVIPGIVNTFIGLFKDTTLVLIVGMFDLLGQIQSSFTDPTWSTPSTGHTGYLFAAIVFFIFCFGMSRYSIYMENRLHTGHKR
ncbi:Inner membrane amino-acid ABC transporter permease protein YhdY [Roseibium album]|jgi:general L-amino acid transport system permease protein|nr:Inner membrane amino-acid ABC transporter permease protein YhdY [Roseibium album]